MSAEAQVAPYAGATAWARNVAAPVRDFLSTETGGAAVMLGAAILALVWANLPSHSYESLWSTRLSLSAGSHTISLDLRHWVNEGLMTLFFLVIGLEAKRELDLGELRERRRLAVPLLAALGGMATPVAIYLAFNAGGSGAHGWAAAMSTDTAFALGALALLRPRAAARMRVFLLTLAVFDDLSALVVIAILYTSEISLVALAVAAGLFAVLLAVGRAPLNWRRPLSILVGVALWGAMFESGVDPVVCGLAIGLATSAYTPAREDLERATALTRSFREQPTPELARSAQRGLQAAISPNERLQHALHPFVSYAVVPLFALANAGLPLSGGLLSDALSSPIFLGIAAGYILGKPLGISAGSWLASRPALRGPRSPLSGPSIAAGGACAGVGFTVSLLIASLAFSGQRLNEAKLGALVTVALAPAASWVALALVRRLPSAMRARQIGRTSEDIPDLFDDVDPARDHVRGDPGAPVTLLEYGDFQCPYCGQAERVIRELLSAEGHDLRYVWRHLPLGDVHPDAQLAAEVAEAAGAQGAFWEMYDKLLSHQDELQPRQLIAYAEQLGLDVERFQSELRSRAHASRVSEDVQGADASGVSGTPTFFLNGRRHYGVYDLETLTAAVESVKRRALVSRPEGLPQT
jgi:Na+/H+ antiporter NhaA